MNIAPVSISGQDKLKAHQDNYNPEIPDVDYNDISLIASEICNTPASLVCIIDANHQWIKALNIAGNSSVAADFPFCNKSEIFIIPDLSKEKQFRSHAYVSGTPHAVFYAGVRLVNSEGNTMGTLCVLDTKPANLEDSQIKALQALGKQVASMLE